MHLSGMRLIELALMSLSHVDEVGQNFLFGDGNAAKMPPNDLKTRLDSISRIKSVSYFDELSFVEAGTRLELEMAFVSTQRVHLKLTEIDLTRGRPMSATIDRVDRVSRSYVVGIARLIVFRVFSASFRASVALEHVFRSFGGGTRMGFFGARRGSKWRKCADSPLKVQGRVSLLR